VPTFTTIRGTEVYIPFHGMVMCEAGEGGLTTMVWAASTMDGKPVGVAVKGTFDTVKEAFMVEALQLAQLPPGSIQ